MNCTPLFKKAVQAGRSLSLTDVDSVNNILKQLAETAIKKTPLILEANKKDLARMSESDPRYDRLMLTKERIESIADDIRKVAQLPSPLGRVLSESERPNGLKITRMSVPFGVIGIIYEARPNVTFDVFSLCFKSGNACILKGGSDAINSNTAITGK